MLKRIACNDEKPINHVKIQEPCRISDEALCNFLPLPVVTKTFIVAEFLDRSLKTLPYTKTSRFCVKSSLFFLLFRIMATFIERNCVLLLLFTV